MLCPDTTHEAIAREWHGNWKDARSPYYTEQILRRLEADVFPAIGRRPIAELEPPELLDMLRKVEKRGANEMARRLKQLVGQIFRFAIVTSRAKRDPSADLKDALRTTGEPRHHRAMPLLELPAFLQKLETYSGEQQTKLALKLMTLTFLRTTELRAGKWNELENLDENSAQWRVPAERMKMDQDHIVPLSRQAVDLLTELKTLTGGQRWLFPNAHRPKKYMGVTTINRVLQRIGYHGQFSAHGFRATASTMLNEMGFRSDVVERQLAHSERDQSRASYNRAEYLEERQMMMQHWADFIDALSTGQKVLGFRRVAAARAVEGGHVLQRDQDVAVELYVGDFVGIERKRFHAAHQETDWLWAITWNPT
jgi:integrase